MATEWPIASPPAGGSALAWWLVLGSAFAAQIVRVLCGLTIQHDGAAGVAEECGAVGLVEVNGPGGVLDAGESRAWWLFRRHQSTVENAVRSRPPRHTIGRIGPEDCVPTLPPQGGGLGGANVPRLRAAPEAVQSTADGN